MNCPACGFQNPEGIKFCGNCAEPLSASLICADCGFENPRGFRFCGECARPLGSEERPSSPERSPRSYTPKHLAEKILHGKSALEGERKQVTVLFADVKGSMDLAEQVDPEEWHRILNRFFEILTDGVHRFEGTVNQYTGDGIMALFGAPIAHEDHAQRACYAALYLKDELRRYSDELRLSQGLGFSVRMGLNSGEVVVGKIGNDLRMDYTAQGQTVGLAARMEQMAAPDRIYLAQEMAGLIEGFFELRDLGESPLPGLRDPIRVYELEGTGRLRTRLELSRARGFSKFVGRDDEMGTLEAALRRATEGNGQVVGVVGEAGVGKSRLCLEFVERCRAHGTPVYEAHCPAHGKTIPFLPLLELLRNLFGISERDSDHEARRKIVGELLLLDETFQQMLPLVLDFLGVPEPDRPAPAMDPEARQRQLFAFVRKLVEARSARETAVTLVDDLHWIDAGSDSFLAQIVEAVRSTRTLLLVNFRPEYHAEWMGKSYYQQLPLLPLGRAAIQELLDDLLGRDTSVSALPERIRERTAGNPFFIEEVVESLVEGGSLTGARGARRLVTPVEALEIPATVQVVLAARIDRLAEREKQVLRTAAVIGKRFPERLLEAVAELPERDLAASLSALREAEFIHEEALYPEAEYAFKHPLTHEVALHSQLQEGRRRTHYTVARAIEEASAGKLEEQAALLAHHWEEAGEALEAARWHRRAAETVALAHYGESVRHWEAVRRLAAGLPESEETVELQLAACSAILVHSFFVRGLSSEQSSVLFAEGRDFAERTADPRALIELLLAYSRARFGAGEYREAEELAESALRRIAPLEDPRLELYALWRLVTYQLMEGDLRAVLETSAQLLEAMPEEKPPSNPEQVRIYTLTLTWRATALAGLGRLAEAEELAARAIDEAWKHDDPECRVHVFASYTLTPGEILSVNAETVARARQALEETENLGSARLRANARMALGTIYTRTGDWDAAAACMRTAEEIQHEHRLSRGSPSVNLAELLLERGDAAGAETAASKGLQLEQLAQGRLWRCRAFLAHGRAVIRTEGRAALASIDESFTRAQKIVDETGAVAYQPLVHIARAELAQLLGDETTRERELGEAQRIYTEMGATAQAEHVARDLRP